MTTMIQGSGIGPLMFLVYINELIYVLEEHGITVKLFADDVKMYARIIHDVDMARLQCAITSLVEWAGDWQLGISVEKCCVLNIGQQAHIPRLYLGNSELPVVPQTRDLGIVLCDDLSPTLHINEIVSKAHKRAMLIARSFISRDVSLLIRAYLTYVRPLLEHNSVIWSPYTIKDIVAIESVQRRFTKNLPGFRTYSYPERFIHSLLRITGCGS